MTTTQQFDTDVAIVGAGPTGLVLANLLGQRGLRVKLIEKRADLIDYPRGVGLDDESFRTIQTMGLVDEVTPFTVSHHIMRLVNGKGEIIMTNDPKGEPFGWPRKHGFLQPLVDRAFYEGLSRYPKVEIQFGQELTSITEIDGGVRITLDAVSGEEGEEKLGQSSEVTARFLVGSEGGRSFTRKWMGTEFEGKSPSTRWVVVDCNNDPLGFPNVYLGADPKRPYVSIGLPQGVRRFEFMLFDDEPSEIVEDDAFVAKLLSDHLPEGTELDIIRRRVFTHHGRIAATFRKGNVLIAGDAAHLMPVWMGQGFNSGLRDVTNLAWKLEAVLQGWASDELLDTYDVERRDHAKAMIDLSMTLGSIIKPTDRKVVFARDVAARAVNMVPQAKDYFADMKFKPMPRYGRGVVVDQTSLESGRADVANDPARLPRLVSSRFALNKKSPVGAQFAQPRVARDGEEMLLDDALGSGFAVISWGIDPARLLNENQIQQLHKMGGTLVCVVSSTQVEWANNHCSSDTIVISDITGALKTWFDHRAVGTVIVRPDRFVGAALLNSQVSAGWDSLMAAGHFN